jgi:hypothetical protein
MDTKVFKVTRDPRVPVETRGLEEDRVLEDHRVV